ncbi:PAS domain S-box protein, partial [Pontibacter diazotrophicus]
LFYKKYNEEGEEYTLYALSGARHEDFAHLPVIRHTPILDPTLRGEHIVRSDDITKDPRYGQNRPHHGMPEGHLPVRSYMALPVVTRSGNVIGGLFFGHPEPGVFSENEEELVKNIAGQAAAAIDNARLFEAKQQAEQKARLIIESIPQMAWTALPDGSLDFFNRRWLEFTGQTAEQAQGEGWQEVFHPEDLSLTVDAWQRSLSSQQDFEVEHRIRCGADGSYRWHLSRGVPVKDCDGNILQWVGTNTDIDDRMQAQKKIREREKLFREAEMVGNTGSYEADLATLRFSFSDNLYRLLGYEPQSFVPSLDFIDAVSHPEDVADARPIIKKAIRDKQPYEYVRRIYRPDGQMRYFTVKGKVTLDKLGSPVKILGKVQDITEQKEAEQVINKHLTLLKQAEETARIGSWEYDIDTGALHWSKGMYRLFGIPEGSPVKPELYLDYVIEEDRPVAERIVHHFRESQEPLEETIRIRPNSQVVTMRVKAVLLRDKQGRGKKTLGVNLDISEIKQLEQENLELRLDQQKGLLLAILEA